MNANGTRYTTSDHLGSPRVVTNSSAGVASRHDYMPFGEELFNGGRTFGMGYGTTDGIRQKFTSKERDNETGLDYFLARYYSYAQGRFTSPDEFSGGPDEYYEFHNLASQNPTFYSDLTDPQSLNKYQYAYGNPLLYIDPDGHQGVREYARIAVKAAVDSQIGVDKAGVNILIGAYNIGAEGSGNDLIQPLEPNGAVQEVFQHATEVITLVSPLAGRGGTTSVLIAETKQTTVIAARTVNAGVGSKTAVEMAADLSAQTGKTSVGYRTPNKKGHIDLKDVRNPAGHFDKATGRRIKAPTVQEKSLQVGGDARVNTKGKETTRPATKQDIRTARKLIGRQ